MFGVDVLNARAVDDPVVQIMFECEWDQYGGPLSMDACTSVPIYLDVCGQMYVVGNPMPFMALPGAPCESITERGSQ